MNRRTVARLGVVGLSLTAALVLVATITGAARVGPVVFWAVHRTADRSGSTVALRPGAGLALVWGFLALLALLSARHQRRSEPPGR